MRVPGDFRKSGFGGVVGTKTYLNCEAGRLTGKVEPRKDLRGEIQDNTGERTFQVFTCW